MLAEVSNLKDRYYCVLSTGNMDSFNRFTLASNPQLIELFNEINNSYNIRISKISNGGKYFKDKVKG